MKKYKGLTRHLLAGTAAVAMLGGVVTVAPTASVVAQDYTTGLMHGQVQDTAGNPITGATVVVSSNRGSNSNITTDLQGSFRLMRLTQGTYTVSISADGFADLADQEVRINVGKESNVTFTLASESANVEEIVVVGTAVGNWDFNSTTTGISVNVDELFEKAPVARNITDITILTPGSSQADSQFGNTVSFNGSSAGENVFYVNGFNITDVSNMISAVTVPFDMYETVEVKTGGYAAEFGRSTGGVVNTVTRSGSNEFHFGGNIYYEPNFLREQVPNITSSNNSHNTDSNYEWNIWASGPIVEDKLFFYALFNPGTTKSFSYGNTTANADRNSDPFYGLKFDFTPFDGHRLEYTRFDTQSQTDRTTFDFNTQGVESDDIDDAASLVGGERGTTFFRGGGEVDILRYTGVITDWFTISGMYGTLATDSTSQSTADDKPVVYQYDDGTFIQQGEWVNFSTGTQTEYREAFRADADVYFNLAGEHHLRIGTDVEKLNLSQFSVLSGGAYYLYWDGDYPATAVDEANPSVNEWVRVRDFSNGGSFDSKQTAIYIQDSWSVTDNLTLNIGLRNETFKNRNANREVFLDMSDQLAYRLGFTYDVGGKGVGRLYGSANRYHLPAAANTAFRQAGAETYTHSFYERTGLTSSGVPTFDSSARLALDVFADGDTPTSETFVDVNLDSMYQDEYILGYEHALGNGWTVGARVMHRYIGRLMEDVAIDAAVIEWAADNGYGDVSDIWSGFHQYVITNPGEDMIVSTYDLPGENGDEVIMELSADQLGYPKGKRKYQSLDLEFRREWDGKWFLQGSYTLSRSVGNYEGNIKSDNGQDDAGITTDFDVRGLVDGAYGKLPNHRAHRLKAWGAYALTDQITMGGRVDIESPRLQGCLGIHPTDAFAALYGSASWYCDGVLTPRGSQMKTGWTKKIDLNITIRPSINSSIPGDLTLRVDAFNIFNAQTASRNVETGSSPYFGKPADYQSPRRVRLGASYRF